MTEWQRLATLEWALRGRSGIKPDRCFVGQLALIYRLDMLLENVFGGKKRGWG
jgi:hypothetical protein